MVRPELGTKRICPETGRKFYDLNKDPIVSPYTGASYPRSYFESSSAIIEKEEEPEEKELDAEEGAEIVSLEEVDEEGKADGVPGIDDDEDVDLGDDDEDDTFLAADEDEDDDVSAIIDVEGDDDET